MSRKRFADDERIEGQVVDLSSDGRGVVRHDEGKTVFVADALAGERVVYRRRKRRRSYDEAELLDVIEASPDRVQPRCAHFGQCGGCTLQHLAPEAQLAAKQNQLAAAFSRIGDVTPEQWLAPLTGPHWHYRRRARLGCKSVYGKGRVLVGFRERNGRYIADINSCPVLDERIGRLLMPLSELLGALSCPEQLPQIEVSAGDDDLVLLLRHLQPLTDNDEQALRAFATEHGLHWYLQSGGPDSIRPLVAPVVLSYQLPAYAVRVAFGPSDFIQVNAGLNQAMIAQALTLLDAAPGTTVLELFAGLGNFTLPLARQGLKVTAVEGSEDLVGRGRENAEKHDLQVNYHVADLFKLSGDEIWLQPDYDMALLDPPRSGAAELLPQLLKNPPRRIVYVSCHPGSLARDAGTLVQAGYQLSAAGVMDMFPHTGHVESIARFDLRP